jgi:hypothetical protein
VIAPSDKSEALFLGEAEQIKTIHQQLVGMRQTMIERMIEAGEILNRVKEGLPRGSWMPWVKKHIPELNHRTINRYMLSYRRRDDPLLQEDPVRFVAEISGNIGKLEAQSAQSTSTSNLDESEIPDAEAESEEGIPDVIKSLEETSEMPPPRRPRGSSREISPEVKALLNMPTTTAPVPEKTHSASDTNKSVQSQWLAAVSAAQEAIGELERLQASYQLHSFDFEPVKKILTQAEHLQVPHIVTDTSEMRLRAERI